MACNNYNSSSFVKCAEFKGFKLNALDYESDEFLVFVSKEGSRNYVVYSEEHEPDELASLIDGTASYTNREAAMIAGAKFANYFAELYLDNQEEAA